METIKVNFPLKSYQTKFGQTLLNSHYTLRCISYLDFVFSCCFLCTVAWNEVSHYGLNVVCPCGSCRTELFKIYLLQLHWGVWGFHCFWFVFSNRCICIKQKYLLSNKNLLKLQFNMIKENVQWNCILLCLFFIIINTNHPIDTAAPAETCMHINVRAAK